MEYNFVDVLITIVLSLIMFGVGLSLQLQNFSNLFKKPKPIIVGLSSQMLFLPALAFSFGVISNLPPEIKVGILILSVCPGGTTSNFITYLLNGNTALSISLTTLNSFITLFSIPIIVNIGLVYFLGEGTEFHLPFLKTIAQIFYITILPASIGVYINTKHQKTAFKLNKQITFSLIPKLKFNYIKSTTIILLAIVFVIKLFASEASGGAGLTKDDFVDILPTVFFFNILGLAFGYFNSIIFRMKHENTPMTIGIEVGLQNTTLAFLVAGTLLQNVEMQKPALIYAFFSFWTAIAFGLLTKKHKI